MATRVFELAREIGVRSKEVLVKCRAEGLEIKNHMTTLSIGLEATIREWFSESEGAGGTAVELTEHVDLAKARSKAKKSRKKKTPPPQAAAEADESVQASAEVAAPEITGADLSEATEVSAPAEVAEAPAAVEIPGEAPPDGPVVVEAPVADEVASADSAGDSAPAEAVLDAAAPETSPQAQPADAETRTESPVAEEESAPAPEAEPPEQPKEPEVVIGPAGPQVVPRPATLKGPRIVRVERPDFVSAPPRRRTPAPGTQRPASRPSSTGAKETVDAAPKRGKGRGAATGDTARGTPGRRHNPRRRGSKNAVETGDRIKEWRDKDLAERSERLAAASGGHRRYRSGKGGYRTSSESGVKAGRVEIDEPITVKSLSAATGLKAGEIIKKLMALEVLATVNQSVDTAMAEEIVVEYGIELAVRRSQTAEQELLEQLGARQEGRKTSRAPVVTFLGHVDHGKTSLLDYIRRTSVAEGEAGGITQHIGAYRYDDAERHVVFLDTPGHEAFTAMRARGANMTDVVVLVVAADDGVMPQTVEAISHAKAAGVPIVVALNKVDVPNANIQRALGQLSEHDLQPRQWGGQTEVIETSAITGDGVDTLVETLSLEAELLELDAEVDAPARGYVIEAQIKSGLGVVARLLVRNGTMRIGDVLLAGCGYGRVRHMTDSRGRSITEAGPATPIEVSGLSEVPQAGDEFFIVGDIEEARSVAEDRKSRNRAETLSRNEKVTLENLFNQIEAGQIDEVPVIIKADVQGSIEALTGSLSKFSSSDEIRLVILHAAVGGISTGDVALAEASNAIIIGFNVVADASARQKAEASGVDIRLYRVIYEIIEDIRRVLEQGLAPEVRQEHVGRAEVRQVFKISRLGTIAGCIVIDGLAQRNAQVRIVRNSTVIEDGRSLDSLKRFKDDAREVRSGMECGLKVAGYDDIKEGDVLEFYRIIEVARTL